MEKRIIYTGSIVFLHMVMTLPLIDLVHCCDDGTGSQGDCQRFTMELSNQTAGNLNWVVGDIASMIKSPFYEDIFYLTIQNGGFYKFNITDSSHEYVTHSAELRNIDQLIQVEKSLMLAVDESENLVVLVSLDNTSSDTTLLCKKDDCCLNHSLCFHSSDLQLGRVVANLEHPYHLFYIDGTRLMELNLTTQNNMTKQISILPHIDEAKSVLQLTITKDFKRLTAVTQDENGIIKALLYHTFDLTSSSEDRGKLSLLLAPPNVESLLQLSNDALVGLSLRDSNLEMILIDMVLNRTQKICIVDNSKNILLTSPDQKKHCQDKSVFTSITIDEDYIYAVEALGKKRMLIIHYSALETWRSPPGEKSSTVTVHAETDSQDEPNWMEISTITMGTVMSLLIVGAVSYYLFVCMRRHRRSSKRHTINQPQAQSHDIQGWPK